MSKYPYTFEEFKKESEKRFLEKYYKSNKSKGLEKLKNKDVQNAIKDGYDGNKFKHENNISEALDKLENEVSGTTYCMYLLSE